MPSHDDQQSGRRLAALVRQIQQSEQQERTVAEAELWAYALHVLEPDERDRVMQRVAASEAAQEELARIRESLGAMGGIAHMLEQAWQRVAEKLTAMGQDLAVVCQVVVRTGDGLLAAIERGTRVMLDTLAPALQPVLLDDQAEDTGRKVVQRIDIQGPEGMSAAVLRLPDGQIDIDVTLSDSTIQGRVDLVRLEGGERVCREEMTGIDAPLKGGRARLQNCPEGILKIRAPDGREMFLGITPAESP